MIFSTNFFSFDILLKYICIANKNDDFVYEINTFSLEITVSQGTSHHFHMHVYLKATNLKTQETLFTFLSTIL
jgi:translation elongation factor EF-1alpha